MPERGMVRPRVADPDEVMVFSTPWKHWQTKRMQRKTTNAREP